VKEVGHLRNRLILVLFLFWCLFFLLGGLACKRVGCFSRRAVVSCFFVVGFGGPGMFSLVALRRVT